MIIEIREDIKDEDFEAIKKAEDTEIIFDLKNMKYLSSKLITKFLILNSEGKKIELINTNQHIAETIKILNLGNIIKVRC